MKSYQWITLIAALLITASEVLVFAREGEGAQAAQQEANVAAPADFGSGTHSPGG